MSSQDVSYMRRALRLAERARGRTAPNPPVGALVVTDQEVVGQGWHKGAGLAHAEVEALDQAGERARGATLYLTLEPCTHEGRTPACAPRVIASGLARVVIGAQDPNPRESGAGTRALTEAWIDVTSWVLGEDAGALVQSFGKWIGSGRPFVTAKFAASLDGRVAAADGSSKWITSLASRRDAHRLRGSSNAVLVGVGTVLADDPKLTCRLRGYQGGQPLRVVLDSTGRTPPAAAVVDEAALTLIATTAKAPDDAVEALRATGAEVIRFPVHHGRVDLNAVIEELGRRNVMDLLVEGGPTVLGELIERKLVGRYVLYLAPKLLGELGLAAITGLVTANIADARDLSITSVRRTGPDVRIEAKPRT